MNTNLINPTGKSYSQALEINNFKRLVFISGQIPETKEGIVPAAFEEQCRLAWKNVEVQLNDAGMGYENLVKVTVFLSDRIYREENSRIRKELLGEISPALTIIIAETRRHCEAHETICNNSNLSAEAIEAIAAE